MKKILMIVGLFLVSSLVMGSIFLMELNDEKMNEKLSQYYDESLTWPENFEECISSGGSTKESSEDLQKGLGCLFGVSTLQNIEAFHQCELQGGMVSVTDSLKSGSWDSCSMLFYESGE